MRPAKVAKRSNAACDDPDCRQSKIPFDPSKFNNEIAKKPRIYLRDSSDPYDHGNKPDDVSPYRGIEPKDPCDKLILAIKSVDIDAVRQLIADGHPMSEHTMYSTQWDANNPITRALIHANCPLTEWLLVDVLDQMFFESDDQDIELEFVEYLIAHGCVISSQVLNSIDSQEIDEGRQKEIAKLALTHGCELTVSVMRIIYKLELDDLLIQRVGKEVPSILFGIFDAGMNSHASDEAEVAEQFIKDGHGISADVLQLAVNLGAHEPIHLMLDRGCAVRDDTFQRILNDMDEADEGYRGCHISMKQMLIKMSRNRGETLDNLLERVNKVEITKSITQEIKDETVEYLRANYDKPKTCEELWPETQESDSSSDS